MRGDELSGQMMPSRGRLTTVLVLEVVAVAFSAWAALGDVYDNTFSRVLTWLIAGVLTADLARNVARFTAARHRP
jgi:hypothetical protein